MILFLLCKSLIEGKFIKIDVINEEFRIFKLIWKQLFVIMTKIGLFSNSSRMCGN